MENKKKRKDVALATGHSVYNYGTRLQAFAMQKIMESKNKSYEIIHCNPSSSPLKGKINYFLKYKGFISKDLYIKRNRNKSLRSVLKNTQEKDALLQQNLLKRFETFDTFNKENLNIRELTCSYKELSDVSKDYNYVFCGSDQAWLPANVKRHIYTLEFCAEGVKRASYAPSFGVDRLTFEEKSVYIQYLEKMDYISVRETSGQTIIKELTGKEVPVVLDPTLLVDRSIWESKLVKRSDLPEKYIFCYFLGDNEEHRLAVKKLQEETGLPIVNLPHMKCFVKADVDFAQYDLYDISPFEFIGLISQATYVCSDSFHCAAFSIHFERDFFIFKRFSDKDSAGTNTRLYSLLGLLNLENRIYEKGVLTLEKIDYTMVNRLLKELRIQSNQYLDTVFKEN